MMKILFVLLFSSVCIYAFAQDRKIISDCTITYSIVKTHTSEQENIGSKIIYIKGKDIKIDLKSNAFDQTIFYNSNSGAATVLKNIGESKYISQYNASDWKKANVMFDSAIISFTNNVKKILKYDCKEAIIKLKNGSTYTVYFAPLLTPSVMESPFETKNIPGLVLEYKSMLKDDEAILYSAEKIDFMPVPSLQFDIPKTGYRILH